MDSMREADRRRYQAEELRAKADLMSNEQVRSQYLKMAEAYEAIADSEERKSSQGRFRR